MKTKLQSGGLMFSSVACGYQGITVLRDLNLSTQPGQVHLLLGKNGSGKSTVLKAAIGLADVLAGEIHFRGQAISHLATHQRANRGIGYLPQISPVFPSFTVNEHLSFAGRSMPSRQRRRSVRSILEEFEAISKRTSVLANSLSGGEQRLLAVASLLLRPNLAILVDEPTAGLSPENANRVLAVIRKETTRRQIPTLLAEQRPDIAEPFADRTTYIAAGTATGTPEAAQPTSFAGDAQEEECPNSN